MGFVTHAATLAIVVGERAPDTQLFRVESDGSPSQLELVSIGAGANRVRVLADWVERAEPGPVLLLPMCPSLGLISRVLFERHPKESRMSGTGQFHDTPHGLMTCECCRVRDQRRATL